MKNFIKNTSKFILTGVLALSSLLTAIPTPVKANTQNVVGDVAIRGGVTGNTYSSFRWQSIPGYRPTSTQTYSLIDSNGDVHDAICIDSTKKDGVDEDLPMTMVSEESGTLRSGAVTALLTGNVSGSSYSVRVPAQVLSSGSINTAFDVSSTISRGDMEMAMRWLAWTTVDNSPTDAWRSDMINLVSNGIPTLYFNRTKVTIEQNEYTNESLGQRPDQDSDDAGLMMTVRVISSEIVTPDNYETVITNEEVKNTYRNVLNGIAQQVRNRVEDVARNFAGSRITIWQGRSDRQRFATVNYIEQSTKISMQKASANPEISNNNSKYNLAGIKYGLYKANNNEYIGEFTLNGDGSSNLIETQVVKPNDQVYIQEIDDATRKTSGYKLNPNKVYHTITRGENVINTTDIPMDDPIVIELFKYDNKTGKKYDKLGV